MPRAKTEAFPKSYRVLRRPEFQRAVNRGTHYQNRLFKMALWDRGDRHPARLGLSVTRKFGKAVVRNRAKRRVREVFRKNAPSIANGYDLVILIRAPAADCDMNHFRESFLDLLKKACLLEKK